MKEIGWTSILEIFIISATWDQKQGPDCYDMIKQFLGKLTEQ